MFTRVKFWKGKNHFTSLIVMTLKLFSKDNQPIIKMYLIIMLFWLSIQKNQDQNAQY